MIQFELLTSAKRAYQTMHLSNYFIDDSGKLATLTI